ncbi:hypothetical protein SLEP1_g59273 [Rubroshorea leprosula]|uniref:Uncharacterized protein n=1 Tax=Rubroshorea leprosula TaxID=152421 RepID=A0AAV5MT02_9ROSI|nr:hypothetical protein SLEP1_g59273 [Rubroshorea leprosula]
MLRVGFLQLTQQQPSNYFPLSTQPSPFFLSLSLSFPISLLFSILTKSIFLLTSILILIICNLIFLLTTSIPSNPPPTDLLSPPPPCSAVSPASSKSASGFDASARFDSGFDASLSSVLP